MSRHESKGVCVVTGGSRGIGRGVAIEAATRGYDVVIGCRSQADSAIADINVLGRRCLVVVGDLAHIGAVEDLAGRARSFGPISLLVNNAGITNSGPIAELTIERWQQTVDLNLTAPAWLAKLLAPDLRNQRGAILNVASTGGVTGSVHSLPYGSTKAGMIGLTKTLARMLAPDVRVNAICPGPIDTDLLDGISREQLAGLVAATPLARLGDVSEVSRAILDVSEWTYCTGQTVVIDGGRVML